MPRGSDGDGEGGASRRWAEPVTSDSVVVIAASAGGLEAIGAVLEALPADFPAAISVVQHRGEGHAELLPYLLQRRTKLRVRHARDGDRLRAGTVYVCPPGVHMTAERSIRLVAGPRLEHVRPSANLMFESVASVYGPRAFGVVLSGQGSDGASGAQAIAVAGGTVIAQDPSTSAHAAMPAAAVRSGAAQQVLPLSDVGEHLVRVVGAATRDGRARAPASTTVLIVDDHRIMVDGLHTLLELESDIVVVGDASDGRNAVRMVERLVPDVVVMDIAMPGLNGIEATRRVRARSPNTSVIALSARTDPATIASVLRAGALGYLSKNDAFDELARAVRSVAAGHEYLSRSVAGVAGASAQLGPPPDDAAESLTGLERELLQRMAEGESTESMSEVLGLSPKSIEEQGRAVMKKLGLANVVALTRYALREGLTSLDY